MSLIQKPSSLAIDPDNPFASDCFGLDKFADALTQVVIHTPESFVINLEAPWGQGKTTFLEMWRYQLRKQGVESLYFNAWENDFSGDPLIALMGELSAGMDSMRVGADSPARARLNKLKKIGARVAVRALPAVIKAATLGALDLSEAVEEAIAGASEKVAEGEIQRYQEAKASIIEFHQELAKFVCDLPSGGGSNHPLVIVIDELDRCRPDYAISVLETVKHLFAVRGVVFVIATDSRQLANAIRHVYGLAAAAEDYLRRFFDLMIALPVPSTRQFVEALVGRHGLDDFFNQRTHSELRYDRNQAVAAFVAMFDATECSLRDQQKCFILLAISMRGLESNSYLHPLLLCTLIVLRVKRQDLYRRYVRGDIGASELVKELSSSPAARAFFSSKRGYGSTTYAYLVASMMDDQRRQAEVSALRARAESEETGAEAEFAREVLDLMGQHSFRSAHKALMVVLPRIEFFARPASSDEYEY